MVSARSGVFFFGAVHARRRGQLEPSVSWALGKKRTRREIAARVNRRASMSENGTGYAAAGP